MEEALLPRRFIAASPPLHCRLAVPCIIVGEQASLHWPDFNRRLSTLNPRLLQTIYLLTIRRRVLVDMHCGSPRVRVRSEYCSGGVFSPFDVPMMDTMCAQLMNNMCGQT
jgi:hypothetical protein